MTKSEGLPLGSSFRCSRIGLGFDLATVGTRPMFFLAIHAVFICIPDVFICIADDLWSAFLALFFSICPQFGHSHKHFWTLLCYHH